MTSPILGAVARVFSGSGAAVVVAAPTRRPVTVLTFDDGPHPDTTPALIEVLERYGARATFFLIGERALVHPDLVAAVVAAGHELGNHMMCDRPSVWLSPAEFSAELARTSEVLGRHGEVRWWRPGSGMFTPRMVRAAGLLGLRGALGSPWLLATRYAGDSRRRGELLARRAHPGAIAVFHEGTPDRIGVVAITEGYLSGLTERGLSATSLGRLVG